MPHGDDEVYGADDHDRVDKVDRADEHDNAGDYVPRVSGAHIRSTAGGHEKADRATRDQVLDPRTMNVIVGFINKDKISSIHGVISTGKEANVYTAVLNQYDDEGSLTGQAYRAVKIYKTSILSFVDRERYIAGEHRFSDNAHKGSNHKMVRKWAEKEFRNLQRLCRAGIACPVPYALKDNVLLMSFLGHDGIAHPRLQDAVLGPDVTDADEGETEAEREQQSIARQWYELYVQMLSLMRQLYWTCRLVHADLSEFNVLYHDHTLYVIDVSQSVSTDHVHALEFLRMDIGNVNQFFGKRGVDTLTDRTVYEFIQASPASSASSEPETRAQLAEAVEHLFATRPVDEDTAAARAERHVDNEVFRNLYIPRTLDQLYDAEMVARGAGPIGADGADMLDASNPMYARMLADSTSRLALDDDDEEASDDDDDDSDSEDDDDASDASGADKADAREKRPRGKKHEDKEAKRAHKQAVKEAQRENRSKKMPKKVKSKLVAKTTRYKK